MSCECFECDGLGLDPDGYACETCAGVGVLPEDTRWTIVMHPNDVTDCEPILVAITE